MQGTWNSRFLSSVADVDRSGWDELFGQASEGFDYYRACELAPPPMFTYSAASVFDGATLIAGAPAFRGDFRLDLMLEGFPARISSMLYRVAPRLAKLTILGFGSPHADELAMAFNPTIGIDGRSAALEGLLDALETKARTERIATTFLKNVSDRDSQWAADTLRRRGYARIPSLPVATLAIPQSPDAYIDSLSQNMRSNMRRKLKRARNIRVEVRQSIDGIEDEIYQLRQLTLRRASTSYDAFAEVSPAYFRNVLEQVGERAKLLLYWLGDRLIGFAIVLLEPGRLKEKYNGMRYPEGPDNGVFFLNWMTQVRMCVEHDIPELHAGETTYLTKARLGCRLNRSWIYFRHRNPVMNLLFRGASPWIGIDATDPDLKKLGALAPYAEPITGSRV